LSIPENYTLLSTPEINLSNNYGGYFANPYQKADSIVNALDSCSQVKNDAEWSKISTINLSYLH
jgi:hypothetical protein